MKPVAIPAILGLALAVPAQDPARDLAPLPDAHDPVGIAPSAFHVWIATRTSLSRWSRIADDAPVWYGAGRGLPEAGISGICWDAPSGTLRIQGLDGVSYVWSEPAERAEPSTARLECSSRISREVSTEALPDLIPEEDGWLFQDGRLLEPGGRRASIRQAVVVEERELWLATSTAGIWKGRWPSGRVAPMASGLGETCVRKAVAERDGTIWMLGCRGRLARLAPDGALQSIDPRSPRWSALRDAIDIAPAPSRGAVVAVPDGVVRIDAGGVVDSWRGRKAPFGGTPEIVASLEDTVWCLTSHGLGRSVDDGPFRAVPRSDSGGASLRILAIAPARSGLLAGTADGFRQWDGTSWIRPEALAHVEHLPVRRIAVDHRRLRVAWSDGIRIRIDTLPGSPDGPAVWSAAKGEPHDFAWGRDGLLQIAHGPWTLWDPADGRERTWNLPVQAEIVVPGSPWSFVAGSTGGLQARTGAWSP